MLERTISRKVVEWLYGHGIIERSDWCQLKASTTLHIHTIFMMLEPISTVVLVAISE